jgi:general secretion pathway protein G
VSKSKQATTRAQIELIGSALDQFRLDNGAYPASLDGLNQKPANAPSWNGPYLKKAIPSDAWGHPYKFKCCPGQFGEYDLWSEGADGTPGGEGENSDIVSWSETTAQQR